MELKGKVYLSQKLQRHRARALLRYQQYAMKHVDNNFSVTIPQSIRNRYRSVLGWTGKGVDSLADRLVFREFMHDDYETNEIFTVNNPDVFFDSVVLSALIASCAFVYISKGPDDLPRLQVIEATNATGVIDPITGLLPEGYAVLARDNLYNPVVEYAVGLSNDAEPMDTLKATVSSMLQFTKDENNDSPTLGQFSTASMSPFTEQLKTAAAGFAGESGLTMDDLGFASDNPSSVEAIKASHENLRLAGRKAQRSLGAGLLNVAYLAACLRDQQPYYRSQFSKTVPKWEPLFEADASALTLIGDGALKLNQAIPGFIDAEIIRDLTGVKGADGSGQ